jgi:hypothetical protein
VTAVDIGQITADARKVRPADVAAKTLRLLLVVIARTLWGIGWAVRKTFAVLWLAGTWSWTAVKLGWQDATPKPLR